MTEPHDFPAEHEWLDLTPPRIRPGFVDDTLARVLADQAERTADAAPDLPADLLATFTVPDPSRSFVDSVAAAVQRDRAESWRELLLHYESPEPSAEFVARTMRALATVPVAARRPTLFLRRAMVGTVLAAAAAILVAVLWPRPPAGSEDLQTAAARSVPVAFAAAFSPSPIAALLRAGAGKPGGLDGLALPVTAPDGIVLIGEGPR